MASELIGRLNAAGAKSQSKQLKLFIVSTIQKTFNQHLIHQKQTKMKPFAYYSALQIDYPYVPDYTTVFVYDKGELIWSGTSKEYSAITKDHPSAVTQTVVNKDLLREHKRRYDEELCRLHKEFQSDLFAEFGVSNNPKKDKAFNLAWNRAVAGDFEDIHVNTYEYFSELVELIKD